MTVEGCDLTASQPGVAARMPAAFRTDAGTACIGQAPAFAFANNGLALHARGVRCRVELPTGGAARAAFLRAAVAALDSARKAGQDNPVLVGALPFDPAAPSCLLVPERWSWQPLPEAPAHPEQPPASMAAPALLSEVTTPGSDAFRQGVGDTVARIRKGRLQKAVLAACQQLAFDRAPDPLAISRRLWAHDAHGYHFQLRLPDGGTLLGASPELLVQKQDGKLLLLPLAGSAARHADADSDRREANALMRSAKDLHEHALVVQDIAQTLAPVCSELHVPAQPALLATSNVWHLATCIKGQLRDPATSVLQLACQLHPTPAICGTPTDLAQQWIRQAEPFDRGLYSGVVGWCDSRGNGQWALAIRCGLFQGRRARLYAGAGIVDGSDPEAEWQEVHNKLRRMRLACGIVEPHTTQEPQPT